MEFLKGCAEGIRRLIAVFHRYVNDFQSLPASLSQLLTTCDCASILLKSYLLGWKKPAKESIRIAR